MKSMVKVINLKYHQTDVRRTIEDAFHDFITLGCKGRNFRPRTIDTHVEHMQYFLDYLEDTNPIPIKYLDEINWKHCQEYVVYMLHDHQNHNSTQRGLRPGTVNIRIRSLKAQFNWYSANNYIGDNPWLQVSQVHTDADPKEGLTENEIARLLSIPDQSTFTGFRNYVLTTLLLDTGMRISECLALNETNVDFKNSVIRLPGQNVKGRRYREVPMGIKSSHLLQGLFAEQQHLRDREPAVFIAVNGTRLKTNSYRKILKRYAEAAGIRKTVSPHILRHTFALHFIHNGGDIFRLQDILGHAEIETTRHYVHMDTSYITAAHRQYSPMSNIEAPRNIGGTYVTTLRTHKVKTSRPTA